MIFVVVVVITAIYTINVCIYREGKKSLNVYICGWQFCAVVWKE